MPGVQKNQSQGSGWAALALRTSVSRPGRVPALEIVNFHSLAVLLHQTPTHPSTMFFGFGNFFLGNCPLPVSIHTKNPSQPSSSSSTQSPSFPKTASSPEVSPASQSSIKMPQEANHNFTYAVGWGRMQSDPGFGASHDNTSVKTQLVNLINSTRTLMRGTLYFTLDLALLNERIDECCAPADLLTEVWYSTSDRDQYCRHTVRASVRMRH